MLYVPFTRRAYEWQLRLSFGSYYEPGYLEYERALLCLLTKKGFADQNRYITQLELVKKITMRIQEK